MTIIDVLNKYDNNQSLSVGDEVLTEGADSDQGVYVILGEIIDLTEENAKIKQGKKYYISGHTTSCHEISTCPVSELKKPIVKRLREQSDLIDWLAKNIT